MYVVSMKALAIANVMLQVTSTPPAVYERRLKAPSQVLARRALSPTHRTCRAVAQRLLPAPALKDYQKCFMDKLTSGETHDWSIPGAEVAAQVDCWCSHNLTTTVEEFGCCDHSDFFPMCTIDCSPDCSTPEAQECVRKCSSMCFEADEYLVDRRACNQCDWERCWPHLSCITSHAVTRVQEGSLERVCHKRDFLASTELRSYKDCWKHAPKHSSHWNVMSSIVNCICREDMKHMLNRTHCCESILYGGGVCNVECNSDAACNSQAAQTCIHGCQQECPAHDLVPSRRCLEKCLSDTSPCFQYLSCRPPSHANYVCDDGQWPEASSGCCNMRCPRLCERQRIWRVDSTQSLPWWLRRFDGPGILLQCSCSDCPASSSDEAQKLSDLVGKGLWEHGQAMLVDIARREGLQLGPNRYMQELMAKRNADIRKIVQESKSINNEVEARLMSINDEYIELITQAARIYGEDEHIVTAESDNEDNDRAETLMVVVIVCTLAVLLVVCVATVVILRNKKTMTLVTAFADQNGQVVIGQPLPPQGAPPNAHQGEPVRVQAPTKEYPTTPHSAPKPM